GILSASPKVGRNRPFFPSKCERTRMPPLMVTGGCGFIGSNFVRHLLTSDPSVEVINFDALTYAGNLANLSDLSANKRYTFVRGQLDGGGPAREGLRAHVRSQRSDHPLLEQLRAVPVPREADPAVRVELARGPTGARVRRRAASARLDPRARPQSCCGPRLAE